MCTVRTFMIHAWHPDLKMFRKGLLFKHREHDRFFLCRSSKVPALCISAIFISHFGSCNQMSVVFSFPASIVSLTCRSLLSRRSQMSSKAITLLTEIFVTTIPCFTHDMFSISVCRCSKIGQLGSNSVVLSHFIYLKNWRPYIRSSPQNLYHRVM